VFIKDGKEYTDSFCTPLLTANGKLAGGAARNVRLANIKDGIDGFARSIVASTLQAIDAQVLDQASAASSACDRTGKVTPIRRIQRRLPRCVSGPPKTRIGVSDPP
jgi:hypothetical protein